MEKRCSICGKDFIEIGNNAEPIRKGICCDSCNTKFVIPARIIKSSFDSGAVISFEVAKCHKEHFKTVQKLSEKNFRQIKAFPYMFVYQNPESLENVILCTI